MPYPLSKTNINKIKYPAPAVNSGCPALTIMDGGRFACPGCGIGWGAVFKPFLIQPKGYIYFYICNRKNISLMWKNSSCQKYH